MKRPFHVRSGFFVLLALLLLAPHSAQAEEDPADPESCSQERASSGDGNTTSSQQASNSSASQENESCQESGITIMGQQVARTVPCNTSVHVHQVPDPSNPGPIEDTIGVHFDCTPEDLAQFIQIAASVVQSLPP